MSIQKILLVAVAVVMVSLSSCKSDSATTSRMSKDFAASADTVKVRMLIESGMPMDSLAMYLCKAAIGEVKGVSINNFSDVDAYIYMNRGEKEYELYALAMDDYTKQLPLVSKLKLYKKSALVDPDKAGYQLGLEYVNDVMDKKLKIGQVDREIADFRQACGEDEDTYNRFLKGFALGISTRAAGEIPQEVAAKYGK